MMSILLTVLYYGWHFLLAVTMLISATATSKCLTKAVVSKKSLDITLDQVRGYGRYETAYWKYIISARTEGKLGEYIDHVRVYSTYVFFCFLLIVCAPIYHISAVVTVAKVLKTEVIFNELYRLLINPVIGITLMVGAFFAVLVIRNISAIDAVCSEADCGGKEAIQ